MDSREYYRNLFNSNFRYTIFNPNINESNVTFTNFTTSLRPAVQLATSLREVTNNLTLAANNNTRTYVFIGENYTVPPRRTLNLRNTTLISLYFGEDIPRTYTINFLPGSRLIIDNGGLVNINIVGNPNITAHNSTFEYMTYDSSDRIAIRSGTYIVNNSTLNGSVLFNYTPELQPTSVRVTNSLARCIALINIANSRINTRLGIVLTGSTVTGAITTGNNNNSVEVGIVR